MEARIRMRHGVAHDLVLIIPKDELDQCVLSMPGWAELANKTYGYVRHHVPGMPVEPPASQDPRIGEWQNGDAGLKRYKIPPEAHLEPAVSLGPGTAVHGLNFVDGNGCPTFRLILIGNRNLGNNQGFVAWHSKEDPKLFRLQGEFFHDDQGQPRIFTMLTYWKDGDLTIESINFKPSGIEYKPYLPQEHPRKEEEIVWCTYGQQVLRKGRLVPIEELLDQFYDIRHIFWFPIHPIGRDFCAPAEEGLQALYKDYPQNNKNLGHWRERLRRELRAGRPRSRYFHNAVGISSGHIIILQRHGTPEEIGQWLRAEGAEDGVILDNGGSVFTWAWWAPRDVIAVGEKELVRRGNVIFCSPEWRPPTISLIAFVLKGPPRHVEPPGAISMAVV